MPRLTHQTAQFFFFSRNASTDITLLAMKRKGLGRRDGTKKDEQKIHLIEASSIIWTIIPNLKYL